MVRTARYVEAHVKHFDTAFRGFFPFVRGLCTLFRPSKLRSPEPKK